MASRKKARSTGFRQLAPPCGTPSESRPTEETSGHNFERGRAGEGRFRIAVLGLIVALCGLAYGNGMFGDFVYDDVVIVKHNPLIAGIDNIPAIFLSEYWESYRDPQEAFPKSYGLYRPLVISTYALNYTLGGLAPFGYHLANLALHVGVTFVIYRLLEILGFSRNAAFAAAALFAVHPIHTEAVTGIVGRAELLMSLGVLLSLLFYIKAGAPGRLQPRYAALSLGAFAAALLSKEQAMVFPAVLALYDVYALKGLPAGSEGKPLWDLIRNGWRRYLGFLMVLGLFLLLRAQIIARSFLAMDRLRISPVDNPLAHVEWPAQVLTALKVAGKYLWLCVWPENLSADYSYNAIPIAGSLWELEVLGSLLAWGGLVSLAVWSYFRGDRRLFFGIGLAVLAFFPASNLVVPIGTIMGERLFYLPSAGLVLLVAAAWDGVAARSTAAFKWLKGGGVVFFGVALLLFTGRTMARNRDWRDDRALFASAHRVVPRSAKVNIFMGMLALRSGKPQEAVKYYETALQIYPALPHKDIGFTFRYGKLLLELGRTNEAVELFELAATLDPTWSLPHYNLGIIYGRFGRYEKAEEALRKSLELNPESADTYNTLSRLYIELGRFQDAVAAADEAIERSPRHVWAHFNRAWALERWGRLEEAMAGYEEVLSIDPDLSGAKSRLAGLKNQLNVAP